MNSLSIVGRSFTWDGGLLEGLKGAQ